MYYICFKKIEKKAISQEKKYIQLRIHINHLSTKKVINLPAGIRWIDVQLCLDLYQNF